MNQPTDERFKRIEEEQRHLKEEVKKLKDQQTEPINIRVDRGLPVPEAVLLQRLMEMAGTQATDIGLLKGSITTLKTDMEGVKADIKAIRESQADFRDALKTVATKEDLAEDISNLEIRIRGDMIAMETRIIDTFKQLLQQKTGE